MILNKRRAKFEAELPIELERIAGKNIDDSYGSGASAGIIRGIVRDIEKRVAAPTISAKFHNSIAETILAAAKMSKMKRVVLSGGVFQNRLLLRLAVAALEALGLEVLTHRDVPANDGGISLGQAVIANFVEGGAEYVSGDSGAG